jgi:hypothetical protein
MKQELEHKKKVIEDMLSGDLSPTKRLDILYDLCVINTKLKLIEINSGDLYPNINMINHKLSIIDTEHTRFIQSIIKGKHESISIGEDFRDLVSVLKTTGVESTPDAFLSTGVEKIRLEKSPLLDCPYCTVRCVGTCNKFKGNVRSEN